MKSLLVSIAILSIQSDDQSGAQLLGLPLTCTADTHWVGISSKDLERQGIRPDENPTGFEFRGHIDPSPSYSQMNDLQRRVHQAGLRNVWRVEPFELGGEVTRWDINQVGLGSLGFFCSADDIWAFELGYRMLSDDGQSKDADLPLLHCKSTTRAFLLNPNNGRFSLTELEALVDGPLGAPNPHIWAGMCS